MFKLFIQSTLTRQPSSRAGLSRSLGIFVKKMLLLAIIPALTNCVKIEGSAELRSSAGDPYSFEGATVEVFDMNAAAALGTGRTVKAVGKASATDGTISLRVLSRKIDDNLLYGVEFKCPPDNDTDACTVESPLRIVLSGAQLKAGGWKASVLTETIFHNIAYYIGAGYPSDETQQMFDHYAGALLLAPTGGADTYDDVLAWNPALTDELKRPNQLGTVSESLAGGIGNNDIKLLARSAVNPIVTTSLLSGTSELAQFWDVVVANGYAYMVGLDVGLVIVDVRDVENPVLVGRTFALGATRELVLAGNFVYAVTSSRVSIVDVSNPAAPVYRGSFSVPGGDAWDVDVEGEYAYVASNTGLHLFNVTNAASPLLVASMPGILPDSVTVSGNNVVITNIDRFHMIDVSNPAAPVLLWTSLPRPSSISPLLEMTSDYIYYTTSSTLYVFDIRNLTSPRLAGQMKANLYGGKKLVLSGDTLYVAASAMAFDVSNPSAPELKGQLGITGFSASLAADGEFVYITKGDTTLSIADPDTVVQPLTQSANLAILGGARDQFTPSADRAYLRVLDGSFSIFDLSDPLAPTLLSNFLPPRPQVASVVAADNYAFMANTFHQAIQVADISNGSRPVMLAVNVPLYNGSYVNGDEGIRRMVLDGPRIFVPWGHSDGYGVPDCLDQGVGGIGGLFTVDIAIPTAPAIAGHVCLPEEAEAVAVTADHAYVTLGNRLLQIVEINDLSQPALAGSLQLSTVARSVAVANDHVWATEGVNGIEIVDVSDSVAPQLITDINTPGEAGGVAFKGNYAYVADGISGLLMFDVSNPAVPKLIASASTRGAAFSVFFKDDYLVTGTTHGIEMFRTLPVSN